MSEYVHQISDEETVRIERFLRMLAIGTGLFVLLIIALFVTADSWLKLISPESEQRFIDAAERALRGAWRARRP